MAKFCIKCGAPVEDGSKFCTKCGAVMDGVKLSNLHEKGNADGSKMGQMEIQKSGNNQGNGSNKNIMIGILIALLVLIGAGSGYYYYTVQQSTAEMATKSAAEKATQEQAAKDKTEADKAKADSSAKEQKNHNEAYARAAVSRLDSGEAALSEFASKINSGTYPKSVLLKQESNLVEDIENRRGTLKNEVQPDAGVVSTANELFSIQIKRANCMAKGIQGEQDQYRIGGNYYDQFQAKYADFKKDNGV